MTEASYSRFYLYKRVVEAKLYIDVNYSEKIDVTDIADEACFSTFHFIRVFKKMYGKTPYQYLIALRLEEAKRLLKKGKPVMDVAFLVGFESSTSFAALFKRETGDTPSAYQEFQKHRIKEMQESPLCFIPGCFAEQYGWLKNNQ